MIPSTDIDLQGPDNSGCTQQSKGQSQHKNQKFAQHDVMEINNINQIYEYQQN